MKILNEEQVGYGCVVQFVEHGWGMYQSRVMTADGHQLFSNMANFDKEKAKSWFLSMVDFERQSRKYGEYAR